MFIVRWIRGLLSLPILWLGLLALYFNQPASIPLLGAAWAVGGDAEVGRSALAATRRFKGRAEALAKARAWLERDPHPHFAATAGLLSLEAGRLDEAKAFLARGRELGDDPMGRLDWLEYAIAGISGGSVAVARQFEARRDLPADLSRAVLQELMFDDLLNGRFDEAKLRAERLLDVDEFAPAEIAMGALAQRAGDEAGAKRHYARAALKLTPAQISYLAFIGYLAIGARAQAEESLAKLRGQDEALALRAEGILKSRESPHDGGTDAALSAGPAGGDHGA
jgi:tetratricopeptide (TPR) repeat protein